MFAGINFCNRVTREKFNGCFQLTEPTSYTLRIGRRTIDKLGIRLYDRAAAVIAELVSNAYDADAENVTIHAPLGEWLANKKDGKIISSSYSIVVEDDGHGMSPDHMSRFYLVVGSDRRLRNKHGSRSPKGRPVTGRKGVGKLAPFGICKQIEIISSGGDPVMVDGNERYRTAHVILDYDAITSDDDTDYKPDVGSSDGQLSENTGTKVILKNFLRRQVPPKERLSGQIGRRFGFSIMEQDDWTLTLKDSEDPEDAGEILTGETVPLMPGTKLLFDSPKPTLRVANSEKSTAKSESGDDLSIDSGFYLDGQFFPIAGWMAYSDKPVKGDHNAGVKIYCRGKVATSTPTFNLSSGFTGEWDVRGYLIGELHCDWLDENEDLIHTDRANIQWSSEEGQEFETWGQKAVKLIARRGREPARKKVEEIFVKTHDLDAELEKRFPSASTSNNDGSGLPPNNNTVFKGRAGEIARKFARRLSPEAAADKEQSAYVLELAYAFAPHLQLYNSLKAAADSDETPTIAAVSKTLLDARIAETHALGAVVRQRLGVLARTRRLLDDSSTSENEMQKTLEGAPWMVRPEWTPLSENKNLSALRVKLEQYLTHKMGEDVFLSAIKHPTKKPDFVMVGSLGPLQVIEIKRPSLDKKFDAKDWERMYNYIEALKGFFHPESGNKSLVENIPGFQITLVANEINLKGQNLDLFKVYKANGILRHLTWNAFLADTERVHQEFLNAIEETT